MNPKADNRNTIASFPLRGAAVVLAAALVGLAGPAAWGQALISAAVTAGDPCDGAFSVSVSISGNTAGPVGTYAFTVTWPAAFTYTNATDGAFGVAPTVGTAGSPNSRNISAFNAGSTLQNGVLFVVNLTNPGDVEGTITMADYGPTPLIGIDFMDIPHTFEPLPIFCGVAQPTDTPTQPGPAPTDTPTSPVVVPTDTSSAPPTDTPAVTVPTDTPITGAVISAHIPGDPCGGQFAVEVAISGNAQQAVGTYAFVLTWPVGLTYVSKADGAFGVAPDVAAGPTENSRVFSAFNAGSTLVNGVLFVVTLDNPESLEGPVTVADFGPTPLIDVGFAEIPHGFQPANVTCGIVQPTETPTGPVVLPTETPTGPVIGPTDTPTGPIVVPTDTPTGPVVEPTGTPTEPVAVPTDTATSPPPPTDTPIEGVVIFPRIVGAPCGGEFAVEVVVAGHEPPAVGTYAFTFHWPEGVSFVGVADGEFGVRPDVAVGTTENSRKISAFNAGSTFVNGVLFVVTLDNSGSIEGPLTVMDFGPTPMIDIAFQPIEHVFLPAAVSCAPPTPTDTPTSPAPPTDTPTQAPPTETPTLPTTDFDEDGILDVFESRRPTTQANWLLPDSDADGLDDGVEDANRDGVRDSNETNPRSADTDGDGWQDGVEVKLLATDPLDDADPEPGMLIDEDGDGLPSSIDPDDSRVDTDGDRYSDTYEAVVLDLAAAANPNVRPTLGDINGDGLVDRADGDLANRIWLGTTPLVLEQTRNADVNGNGWVDALDAMLIHGVELGRTDLLPAR